MEKVEITEIKDMDILLYSNKGNYRIKPTEFEKDFILTFIQKNRNEQSK